MEYGILPNNPATKVKPPSEQRPEVRVWTPEEAKQFLKVAAEIRYFGAYVLALHTGLRRGEIIGLKWDDIDLEKKVLE